MMMSAITNIIVTPEAIELITTQLGYPEYFVPYIGWAKAFGAIAILIPGLDRIKEWAYAGLCFDLVGATYSLFATSGVSAIWGMLPIILFLFASYFLQARIRFYQNGMSDEFSIVLQSEKDEYRMINLEVVTGLPSVETDPTKFVNYR
jgi:hypothetical protein